MKRHKLIAICCFFLLIAGHVKGQGGDNLIYSRFGLGDPVDNNFMHLRNMGSVGAAYNDPYHINIENPASYAFLRAVSFDVAVNARLSTIDDGTQSQNIESGGMEYISIALPLRNKVNEILEREEKVYNFGMAFTLMPHTRVGYNISSIEETPDFGRFERNFRGSGGTYKFMWGNAFRYKEFGLGFNLGYLFGNLDYARNIFFDPTENALSNNFVDEYNISGFIWNAGIQYSFLFNKTSAGIGNLRDQKRLKVGMHYGTNTNLSLTADRYNIAVLSSNRTFISDTLSASLGIEGEGTLPGEFGVGLAYQVGERFNIGVNYVTNNWSAYRNSLNPQELNDSYRFSMGGYYVPNPLSQSSYWDRVYYRYGAYMGRDPQNVSGQEVERFGFTLGLGLPFIYQRRISHVNLGVDLGLRGQGTSVEERYININLAFTFNDSEWFLKRKYN